MAKLWPTCYLKIILNYPRVIVFVNRTWYKLNNIQIAGVSATWLTISIRHECEVWDRQIRPEDHQFASRGLPSDDKRWSRETDFSFPHLTRIMDYFPYSPLNTSFILENNLKKTSRKSWIRWESTWLRHFKITMTSRIDVRPACGCSFLSFPRYCIGVCDRNILHG